MDLVNLTEDSVLVKQCPPEEKEKIFQCELCDYKTAFRASLLNHHVVHSDARPWLCKICDYAAKRKFDLKKHLQVKHRLSIDRESMAHYMSESISQDETGPSFGAPAMHNFYNRTTPASSSETSLHFEVTESLERKHVSHHRASENSSVAYYNYGGQHIKCESVNEGSEDVVYVSSDRGVSAPVNGDRLPPFQGGLVSRGMSFHYNPVIPSGSASGRPITTYVPRVDALPVSDNSFGNSSFSGRGSLNMISASQSQSNSLGMLGRYFGDGNTADRFSSGGGVPIKRPRTTSGLPGDSGDMGSPRTVGMGADRCSSVSSDAGSQTGVTSSSVMQNQGTDTRRVFHCKHCDVMFFDNAMYLMHAGLHQADNPWTCAICRKSFGEKYSFTSHFINQHS